MKRERGERGREVEREREGGDREGKREKERKGLTISDIRVFET